MTHRDMSDTHRCYGQKINRISKCELQKEGQKVTQGKITKNAERESLQGKIALIEKIETISNHYSSDTQVDITSVRSTRNKEKIRCHKGDSP